MKKSFYIFLIISLLFVANISLYAQTEIELSPSVSPKTQLSTGAKLKIAGSFLVSTGAVLELINIGLFFAQSPTDQSSLSEISTFIGNSSNFGLYNALNYTSGAFIGVGASSLIAGLGYSDDSVASKAQWKKTQLILGSVLLSIGGVLSITGGSVYATDLAQQDFVVKTAGAAVIGVGIPFTTAGITSLITAFITK